MTLKINSTHQFLVYADDGNILGRRVQTIKENESLVAVSKEFELEINAHETKYMVMS